MKPVKRICLLVLCVLLIGLAAQAQGLTATVGVPFSYDLLQGSGASLSRSLLRVMSSISLSRVRPTPFPPDSHCPLRAL